MFFYSRSIDKQSLIKNKVDMQFTSKSNSIAFGKSICTLKVGNYGCKGERQFSIMTSNVMFYMIYFLSSLFLL